MGWSWAYVSATSLFVKQFAPPEKAKVLSLNDFVIFSCVAVCIASGGSYFVAVGRNWYFFVTTYAVFMAIGVIATSLAIVLDIAGERKIQGGAKDVLDKGSLPGDTSLRHLPQGGAHRLYPNHTQAPVGPYGYPSPGWHADVGFATSPERAGAGWGRVMMPGQP